MRREIRGGGLRRRMLYTIVPAALGTFGGYLYARYSLDADAFRRLAGMYAAAGAAVAILGLRLFAIFRAIFSDYLSKDD